MVIALKDNGSIQAKKGCSTVRLAQWMIKSRVKYVFHDGCSAFEGICRLAMTALTLNDSLDYQLSR